MVKTGFKPSSLFIYSLTMASLAFIGRSVEFLLIPAVVNGVLGFGLGSRKIGLKLLVALMIINVWGALINAVYFSNVGTTLLDLGFIKINSGVVKAFLMVSLRFFLVVGSTLIMLSLSNARDLIKSLESDLRIPSSVAFSLAYAFRLFPLMTRDFKEISIAREERGLKTFTLNPKHLKTLLTPLLSVGYERALWAGISSEVRGLSSRRKVRSNRNLSVGDLLIFAALSAQVLTAFLTELTLRLF